MLWWRKLWFRLAEEEDEVIFVVYKTLDFSSCKSSNIVEKSVFRILVNVERGRDLMLMVCFISTSCLRYTSSRDTNQLQILIFHAKINICNFVIMQKYNCNMLIMARVEVYNLIICEARATSAQRLFNFQAELTQRFTKIYTFQIKKLTIYTVSSWKQFKYCNKTTRLIYT